MSEDMPQDVELTFKEPFDDGMFERSEQTTRSLAVHHHQDTIYIIFTLYISIMMYIIYTYIIHYKY